jgi:MEMO1 family protein
MGVNLVRPPAVAGRFYPSDASELVKAVDECLLPGIAAQDNIADAKACVVPHAGYMYSGRVAGAVYRRLPAHASYVILGPNHFGRGGQLAVMSGGFWLTPLGRVPLDSPLAELLRQHCAALTEDAQAHAEEHSLEVHLPFLQRRVESFSFTPIAVGAVGYDTLEALGRGVAAAVRGAGRPVMIIASSDMNHYEPDAITRIKDRKAIEAILALDERRLFEVVSQEPVSMCGYGPVVAMLAAAKALGASEAVLEKYATSADAGGDPRAVVGYAGIVVR